MATSIYPYPLERYPSFTFEYSSSEKTGATCHYYTKSKIMVRPLTDSQGRCRTPILDVLKECLELRGDRTIHVDLKKQGLHLYNRELGVYVVRTLRVVGPESLGASRVTPSEDNITGYAVSVYEIETADKTYARFISHQPSEIYKSGFDSEGLFFEEGDASLAELVYRSILWRGGFIEKETPSENFYVYRTRRDNHD